MKLNLDKLNPRNWQSTGYRCHSCGKEVERRVYIRKNFQLHIGALPRKHCPKCDGVMWPILELELDEHNKEALVDRKAKTKEERTNPTILFGFPSPPESGDGYSAMRAKLVRHVPIPRYAVLHSFGENWLGFWEGEYYHIRETSEILDLPDLPNDWRDYLKHQVTGTRLK